MKRKRIIIASDVPPLDPVVARGMHELEAKSIIDCVIHDAATELAERAAQEPRLMPGSRFFRAGRWWEIQNDGTAEVLSNDDEQEPTP